MVESDTKAALEHKVRLIVRSQIHRMQYLEYIKANFDTYFSAKDYLNPAVRPHFDGALRKSTTSLAWLIKYRDFPVNIAFVKLSEAGMLVVLALAEFKSLRGLGARLQSTTGRLALSKEILDWLEDGPPEWAKEAIETLALMRTAERK